MKVGIHRSWHTLAPFHVRAFGRATRRFRSAPSPRVTGCSFRKHAGLAPPGQPNTAIITIYLKDKDVDVVDILLPHSLHAPVIREALQAGKHVICEKPLGNQSKRYYVNQRIVKKDE